MRSVKIAMAAVALLFLGLLAQANWYEYHVYQAGEDETAYLNHGWEIAAQPKPNYFVFRRPRLRF